MIPARALLIAALLLHGLFVGVAAARASLRAAAPRQVLSLDGTWDLGEGGMDAPPAEFAHKVRVPGLVDLAVPALREVGRKSDLRQAFWYRRTFRIEGKVPARAILKIHKAMYGTRVLLNGKRVAEHLPCFTPAYLDVGKFLRGEGTENELIVGVGADRTTLPPGIPSGADPEKLRYIPGIYDSVELILTGTPYIRNIQVVPDVAGKSVRVVAELETDVTGRSGYSGVVNPVAGPDNSIGFNQESVDLVAGMVTTVEQTIPLGDRCRLWSPEDPYLYRFTLSTPGDAASVRFGVRSFSLDPRTGTAMLNGNPYYLRGTNVTLLRFFEDARRGDLPWRTEWVRALHRAYKGMHWNAIRYCIGFPPESWYDIADEEGLLIQDEFPIWVGVRKPLREALTKEQLVPQFTDWMRERWNHPCVVIWDAQNESVTEETGKTIAAVRGLDLSNRPWDNGWSPPQDPARDSTESHPYVFNRTHHTNGRAPFRLAELPTVAGRPTTRAAQQRYGAGIIINEYDWLWLTRDGQPTALTRYVYESLLPGGGTVEQRRELHGRYVAALTEFWRARRQCAGVLHFCGLGYSRPGDQPVPDGGATSDDFVDVERLTFEPRFERYVRDAFDPVGVMLDFWTDHVTVGQRLELPVVVTNDLPAAWKGRVRVDVWRGNELVGQSPAVGCQVEALGQRLEQLSVTMPEHEGDYTIAAVRVSDDGNRVSSLRDVRVGAAR